MKKHLAAALLVTGVAGAGLIGAGVANAATSTNGANPMSSLVDAIASKFNLNKTDVQAVFDAEHSKMEATREADAKAEIAQLVKDGKLTQPQADAITTKRAELDKERDANRTADQKLTDEQRQTKMTERRTALDKWAADNNIPAEYRYLLKGGKGGHGPGGHGGEGRGMMRGDSSSSSTTQTQ
ncbi:MAG: hypothetical protein WAU02_03545 [Candidatus Saccharimonadales bacterium]